MHQGAGTWRQLTAFFAPDFDSTRSILVPSSSTSPTPDYKAEDSIYEEVSSLGSERLCGMVIMHVDDMLGAGCPKSPRYKAVTDLLRENFSFREWKEEEPTLEYCGCQLEKTEAGGRRLHQEPYMGKIKPISFSKDVRCPTTSWTRRSLKSVDCWALSNGQVFRHPLICSVRHQCLLARSPRPRSKRCMSATGSCEVCKGKQRC